MEKRIHDYQQREGRVLFGGTVSLVPLPVSSCRLQGGPFLSDCLADDSTLGRVHALQLLKDTNPNIVSVSLPSSFLLRAHACALLRRMSYRSR